ncbi:hypothetical protein BaRGS_00028048 [Batillaria attramentaria]|uniref:Ig-like domain-containing protein n=1 Tax=Batillaria attramentaria TaxID=370345 RepID=A0ABD0JZZ1_9CAEN
MCDFLLPRLVESLGIHNCKDGWVSIRESGRDPITCQHNTDEVVSWTISTSGANGDVFSGSCSSLDVPCVKEDVTLTTTPTSSDLTIFSDYRRFGNKFVVCREASDDYRCKIRIVYSANFSDCSFWLSGSQLLGYCHLRKQYSSNDFYSCQWKIRYENFQNASAFEIPSIFYAYLEIGQQYYRGMCGFSYSRPVNGTYSLFLTVDPGVQDTHVARVTIHENKALALRCAISPETTRPYTWSGVQCNEGNRNTTCTFTPENVQETVNAVTCLGNFSQSNYNTVTIEAGFVINITGGDRGSSPSGVHHASTTPSETTVTHTGGRMTDAEQSEGSKRSTENQPEENDEFIEHNNTLYEPGDSPYEVNEAYQPESTVQKQPAMTTVDPTYEDHNLDSNDDGYAAIRAGSPQGNGKDSRTNPQSSLDHDLYSSVDAPTSNIPAAVSGPAAQGDEYAVVEKSVKGHTEPSFQPDVYAQVNKSRPKTGGDVYAQVNKPAKRAKSSPVQHDLDERDGKYGEPNPKSTSGSVETSGGDDEYNVLRFQERNSDTPANPDAGQLYSHIDLDPPDSPVITGNCPGHVYRIGDALTLLCIVKGGTPKVKTVAFFCGEHKDSEDVVHQTAVYSAVIIDSLSETDNGTVCNCSARWEKDSTISLTTSITLIVEGQPAPTTVYIETSSKDTNEGGTEENTFPVAAVAGGIGALLAIISIVIVIIIVVRRLRMKTYDRPNRRRDQDTNPYTGLRPTGADRSRISGTENAQGVNEEGQQLASNPRGRLQMPPTEANELRDISNTAASAHAYQNTLQSSAN